MFELNKIEWQELITNCDKLYINIKFSPTLPMAFTEQGVAMLSSVLRSQTAIEVNISIMRAFIAMRKYLSAPATPNLEVSQLKSEIAELKEYIEDVFKDYNDINEDTAMQLDLINQALAELSAKQSMREIIKRNKIGFKR